MYQHSPASKRIQKKRKKHQLPVNQSHQGGALKIPHESVETETYTPADVMQLQRTIGNRATRGLLQRPLQQTPERIQRLTYNDGDWDSVTTVSPAGGVNPVFFLANGNGQSVVVKALSEPPQRAMFAQGLMSDIAGIQTSNTRILDPNSNEVIQQLLPKLQERLNAALEEQNQVYEIFNKLPPEEENGDNSERYKVSAQKIQIDTKVSNLRKGLQGFTSAKALMVMETLQVVALKDLGMESANNTLGINENNATQKYTEIFTKANLWRSLGRIFAVDQFLGNEDRLEGMKIQNVFLNQQGDLVALDNDAIMQEHVREYLVSPNRGNLKQTEKKNLSTGSYINSVIGGGYMYDVSHDPTTNLQERPSANIELIAGDVQQSAGGKFDLLLMKMKMIPQVKVALETNEFKNAQDGLRNTMVSGVTEIRDRLLNMLNDNSLRQRYNQTMNTYGQTFGNDKLFDFKALELRGQYLTSRGQGKNKNDALNDVAPNLNQNLQGLDDYVNTLKQTPDLLANYIGTASLNEIMIDRSTKYIENIKAKNLQGVDSAATRTFLIENLMLQRVSMVRDCMLAMANKYGVKKENYQVLESAKSENISECYELAGRLYNFIPKSLEKKKLKRRNEVNTLREYIKLVREKYNTVSQM